MTEVVFNSPTGGILTGTACLVSYFTGGKMYVLTASGNGYTFQLALNDDFTVSDTALTSLVAFKLSNGPVAGEILMTSVTGVGGIAYLESGSPALIYPSASPSPVSIRQKDYQEWMGNYVALAGVSYSCYTVKGEPLLIDVDGLGTPNMVVYFLPLTQHYGPTGTPVTCTNSADPSFAILNSWCSLSSGSPGCSQNIAPTWVDLNDCYAGVSYKYCPVGVHCGGTCKSPCTDPLLSCTVVDSKFTCSLGDDGSIWTKLWFKLLVAALIVVIFIIIALWLSS